MNILYIIEHNRHFKIKVIIYKKKQKISECNITVLKLMNTSLR